MKILSVCSECGKTLSKISNDLTPEEYFSEPGLRGGSDTEINSHGLCKKHLAKYLAEIRGDSGF